jgi:hypothetical protein
MQFDVDDILVRTRTWPAEARRRLAVIALEIEAGLGCAYRASEDELRAIDEADADGVASEDDVRLAFAAFRAE